MRILTISPALALLIAAAPVQADDRAEIQALQAEWSRAFLASDYEALERIIAPEFTLVRVEGDAPHFTPRERWFANTRGLRFDRYETEIVGLAIAGDTAVATVRGRWTIRRGDETRDESFVVTDTLVRRDGRWQALFRHSSPRPPQPPAPPPPR